MRTLILSQVVIPDVECSDQYGTRGVLFAYKCYLTSDGKPTPVHYQVYLLDKWYRFEQAEYVTDIFFCEELDNALLFEECTAVRIEIPIFAYYEIA